MDYFDFIENESKTFKMNKDPVKKVNIMDHKEFRRLYDKYVDLAILNTKKLWIIYEKEKERLANLSPVEIMIMDICMGRDSNKLNVLMNTEHIISRELKINVRKMIDFYKGNKPSIAIPPFSVVVVNECDSIYVIDPCGRLLHNGYPVRSAFYFNTSKDIPATEDQVVATITKLFVKIGQGCE